MCIFVVIRSMSKPYDLPQRTDLHPEKTWVHQLNYQQETPFTARNIRPQGNVKENHHGIEHAPGVLCGTLYRPQQLISLACKSQDQMYAVDNRLAGSFNSHRPGRQNVGDMRGDPRGLASDWRFKTDTKLMLKRDNFYPWLNSSLGQPK